MSHRVRHLLLIGLTSLLWGWASAADTADSLVVELDAGKIRGALEQAASDVRAFKGIPYAKAPIGDLRWRPPEPPDPWTTVRDALAFGPRCVQRTRPDNPVSEDCLHLNVWTAATSSDEKRPVMVWIHGGALVGGSAGTFYDGTRLAQRGVVVVSINYRLGPLGWLAHPLLTAESKHRASGNYGLHDQIAALRWVQRNIGHFGGDPDRVTVFGESAGSWSVHLLTASPLARGLFHHAIGQSGGVFSSYGGTAALADGETIGERYAMRLVGDQAQPTLAAMRAAGIDAILRPARGAPDSTAAAFSTRPYVDGWALPDTPLSVFRRGAQNKVPTLVGWNANEGSLAMAFGGIPASKADYLAWVREQHGANADAFLAAYPVETDEDARAMYLAAYGDQNFGYEMRTWARLTDQAGYPAFLYHFSRVRPGARAGASHGAEIAYVFERVATLADRYDATDRTISDVMARYWVNFAANGDPNGEGLPEWPRYDGQTDRLIEFADRVEPRQKFRHAQLDFQDLNHAAGPKKSSD